ncbi:MAG: hypothetical protein AAFR98_00220 [Pseudomonadota bacterium]
MVDDKKKKKKKKKDSQLIIRLHKELRDEFVELCDELDTSAAREIRRFITEFLDENQKSSNQEDAA